jgi:hypothetical protein
MTTMKIDTVPDGKPAKPLSRLDWILDAIVRNWRTTGCGLVSAAAMFVASNPAGFPPPVVTGAQFVVGGGLIMLGICAKDSSKSGNPGRPSK